ncbi:MAG: HupE/UreJ family protein [Sedimenticola sp.]
MMLTNKYAVLALALLVPSMAAAHTGHGMTPGLVHGLAHPLGGLDHLLAMIAVGVVAAYAGRRSLWLLPISFVGLMLAGSLVALSAISLPMVEGGILLSVVALGVMIALGVRMPLLPAIGLVGFFGMFHGYAHGLELAVASQALGYMAGFAVTTLALHGSGIMLGRWFQQLPAPVYKLAGAATASTGLALALLS